MSKQNIYVAMGSLAYAIAKADGVIQEEEKQLIKRLAQEELLRDEELDTNWIDDIFNRLETDKISVEDAYNYAIDVLKANKFEYDFYDSTKQKCIKFMEKTAFSFGGISHNEQSIIEQFKRDVTVL